MNINNVNFIDSDKRYAEALQTVMDGSKELLPVELSRRFDAVNAKFYPEFEGPQNLMLQEVYGEILGGRLDPAEARSMGYDPKETLEEIRVIVRDYLAGNFYPTYFLLTISYRDKNRGYSCLVHIEDYRFVVESAFKDIQKKVTEIASKIKVSSEEQQCLQELESRLPKAIDGVTLDSTEIQELLV